MRKEVLCVALVAAALCGCQSAPVLTLVKEGVPRSVIVIRDNPSLTVKLAANELASYVEKISGARLQTVKESGFDPAAGKLPILVGDSKALKKRGYDGAALDGEEWRILSTPDALILFGKDEAVRKKHQDPLSRLNKVGTLFAAYEFLRDELGVRWFWPGELGEHVPRQRTITLRGDLNVVRKPYLWQRHIRNILENRQLKRIAKKHNLSRKEIKRMRREWRLWCKRHFLGTTHHLGGGHAYNHWYTRFGKEHADWFCMDPDGERFTPRPNTKLKGHHFKICTSNPEVIEQALKDGLSYLDARPHAVAFSACPNDGQNFCMCPRCKALDNPKGAPLKFRYYTKKRGDIVIDYVQLTDRYCVFWNALADRLAKERPGKCVKTYAYGPYRKPPVSAKLRPNVIVGYVGAAVAGTEDRKQWDGWAKSGCKLFLRPNHLGGIYGFPTLFPRDLARDFKHCARTGMIAADMCTWHNHGASNGLDLYVLGRLLADHTLDTEDLIDEYCEKGFKEAAPAIKKYVKISEAFCRDYKKSARQGYGKDRALYFRRVGERFSKRYLDKLNACLKKARTLTHDELALKRIAFMKKGLTYAYMQSDILKLAYDVGTTGKNAQRLLDLVGEREAFYKENMYSFAVGVMGLKAKEDRRVFSGYFGIDFYDAYKGKKIVDVLAEWKFKTDEKETGEKQGWHKPACDDSGWKTLLAGKWWEAQGFEGYNGIAWYRRTIRVPEKLKGKKIILRFGGLDDKGWVYFDGKMIYNGEKEKARYLDPVVLDITDRLKFGRDHQIAVRVSDRRGAGGIWKPVVIYAAE